MKSIACVSMMVLAAAAIPPDPSCASELHVSPKAHDSHTGSRSAPLHTIQRAADLAQPGDIVTVHEGVYRERVNPPRGGVSAKKRIVYRAAPGEHVEIKGSEIVRGWEKVKSDVWKVTLPNALFHGFNPYADLIKGDWFDPRGRDHHTGAVYLNGEWLIEARTLDDLFSLSGSREALASQAGEQYLLNVAWLKPGSKNATRTAAVGYSGKDGTRNAPCSEGGECIGFITNGHWVRYDNVEFGPGTDQLEIRAASESEGGIIEIRDAALDGDILGTCSIPNTGGWQSWRSFTARIKPVSGSRTLFLVFRRPASSALNVNLWFARVDAAATTLWAQFPGADPNQELVEINVRRTVFYPDKPNRDFITVRGFTMRDAATPWAPPTAEQIGLIGTHWSKGWIIEDNTISHSTCSGVSLGKYGDEWDNRSANSAEGYVETIQRALKTGWSKDRIGHHVVRRNEISHCEQAGVVGSLGAIFSEVSDNTIHDIHVRRLFSGAEMAGIKFHGAIDTTIRGNRIYRTCLGLWLDWMAQGTRVSGNIFHDNGRDLFTEVDHGPYMVDNNMFLSPASFLTISRGGAFAHNLFAGSLNIIAFDGRMTPFHKPHSTEVAGYHDNPRGDDRYYNNIFIGSADLSQYDDATLPVSMDGNVFLKGARPSRHERGPVVKSNRDPEIRLHEDGTGLYFTAQLESGWMRMRKRPVVTSAILGTAAIPRLPFESPDGASLSITSDILGRRRNRSNPAAGPIEVSRDGMATYRLKPARLPAAESQKARRPGDIPTVW